MVSVSSPYLLSKNIMKNSCKSTKGMKMKNKINELDAEFSEYGGNALEWRRKCELMLPEIVEYEVWREKGCGSVYEYAAKKAGMSKRTVNEALRVMKRIEDKPELMEVALEKGIQRVRAVATIATRETAGFWADKMRNMSKNVGEVYVRNYRERVAPRGDFKPDGVFDGSGKSGVMGCDAESERRTTRVVMELDVELVEKLKRLKGEGGWNDLMERLLEGEEVKESVAEEKPKPVRTKSRHVPVRIQRYVKNKSGGMCAYPGCCRDGEILHHMQRFALEKVHDPDRMVYLCEAHERLVHLGLVEGEDGLPEGWRLRSGVGEDVGLDTMDDISKRYVDQQVDLYRGS